MRSYYYIFKTDHLAEKTTYICGGAYDYEESCDKHWRIYSYGLCDAFSDRFGHQYSAVIGTHERSVRFKLKATGSEDPLFDTEFFMLLGNEGQELIYDLVKYKKNRQ